MICPNCNHVFKPKRGNKKYQKGAAYERIVIGKLRAKGYKCWRAYASRGVYDVIAQKGEITLGIQVKSLSQKNKAYLTPKDRESLNEQLSHTGKYILLNWNMEKHAAMEIEFDQITHIIHAYKEGPTTNWKQLLESDTWIDFKP